MSSPLVDYPDEGLPGGLGWKVEPARKRPTESQESHSVYSLLP